MAMHEDTARFNALIRGRKGNIYFGLPEEMAADFRNSARDILNRRSRKPEPDDPTPAMLMLNLAKLHYDMFNHAAFNKISAMVMASDVDREAQFTAAQLLVMLPGPKMIDAYNEAASLIVLRAEEASPLQSVALETLYQMKIQRIPLKIKLIGF